ncbi:MAG: energy-coupling factor transporter transmembrane component T [Armatimonadota bacterium]|nr:energy-coupling factor transporter transmembrane component T [Armatimonadota bacterium]MDR7438589.1 energy-coupling factor transporter transmembrane component T [Armatimonadota bacterium]MDR7562690.1 energy-coupling factor transporter transmembrane component T [Armatimonadota bacterium]MDR7567647.1 energy-coupling factor transporter transmembrane component T [Armatimonadota bacterium]MDR7601747.1 energy-coupling factor transporter transmembrane component T [Armatimonadota bacterium]
MELLRSLSIGQYIPRNSPVHRLDPRTKLLTTTAFMVALFLVRSFWGFAVFAAFLGVTLALAQIPVGFALRSLRPVLFLLLLALVLQLFFGAPEGGTVLVRLGPLVATREGLIQGLFVTARLVLLIVGTSLLTYTTSPVAIADGLERLLNPLRRVGVPAHELAMMMTIALRFIPTLVEETEKIIKAQMGRGADFQSGGPLRRARALLPVLIPLFVSAFRRAEELALAMEARCYRGGEGRTRMKQLRYTSHDAVAAAAVAAVSTLGLLLGRL